MASAAKATKNQLQRAKKKAQKTGLRSRLGTTEQTPEHSVQEETPEAARIKSEENVKSVNLRDGNPLTDPFILDEENPLFDMYKDIIVRFEEADKQDPPLKSWRSRKSTMTITTIYRMNKRKTRRHRCQRKSGKR
ncbi:hypothetical protein LTR93_010725 [Exophiala xenobiotica]|nr:hypothetical protein LTR93_010725 [Exophiala xenobiotica]